jgi:glycosidase
MGMDKLIILEINTRVWLSDLEKKYGESLTLDNVPSAEWDEMQNMGFNIVWFMGIWGRSPLGKKISQENTSLYEEYSRSLPDWNMEDLTGSPYCIKDYAVDERFGGNSSLAAARAELKRRDIKLILDFVPNHIALDHKWINTHPEYLIPADELDMLRNPRDFFKNTEGVFAKGRDPFFPPWQDVAQLNAYSNPYRIAATNELKKISQMCDGVRCDMAMLMLNRVFSYTWQTRAGTAPSTEFWMDIIPMVKNDHPDMLFIAEAYWGLEYDLQQVGFDFCYDKLLYDRLMQETAETIRLHLQADFNFQSHLLRFIENHDEDRASARISTQRLKAASVLFSTLPGAALFYEGQYEGRKARNQVLLGRRQSEPANSEILSFYKILIPELRKLSPDGEWQMCSVNGWIDNQSCHNILAFTWKNENKKIMIAVNYSDHPSQGKISFPWRVEENTIVKLVDLFGKEPLLREGQELINKGLFVDLPSWGFHYFFVTD